MVSTMRDGIELGTARNGEKRRTVYTRRCDTPVVLNQSLQFIGALTAPAVITVESVKFCNVEYSADENRACADNDRGT